MATRAGINLEQQIRPVGGSAGKTLSGLMIEMSDEIITKQYRAQGFKTNTVNSIHRQFSKGTYKGPASYVEMCLPLAGLLNTTITADSPVVGATKWTFLPNAQGPDTNTFFDFVRGDSYEVQTFRSMCFSSFTLNFGTEECTIDGGTFSKAKSVGDLARTTTPVQYAERLISSADVDIFCDPLFANIGTTKLANAFDAKLTISDKFKQKWTLNSTNNLSYADVYEDAVDVVLTLTIEADAAGIALRAAFLAEGGRFIRISAISDLFVTGSTPYSFKGDVFVKLRGIKDLLDYQGGVYAYELTLGAEQDATMGRAYQFELINALAAL